MSDILDCLREMADLFEAQQAPHNMVLHLRAGADEIARLRAGGCARDQGVTQYCAEAARLAAENERLRAALREVRGCAYMVHGADRALQIIDVALTAQPAAPVSPWMPIETAPKDGMRSHMLLCHDTKKWVRMGRYYSECRRWYYSGTNERSQYAQVEGDEPTHWMPLPAAPGCEA